MECHNKQSKVKQYKLNIERGNGSVAMQVSQVNLFELSPQFDWAQSNKFTWCLLCEDWKYFLPKSNHFRHASISMTLITLNLWKIALSKTEIFGQALTFCSWSVCHKIYFNKKEAKCLACSVYVMNEYPKNSIFHFRLKQHYWVKNNT